MGNHELRRWLKMFQSPGMFRESSLGLLFRMKRSVKRVAEISLSFRTAPGRERLRFGIWQRIPFVLLPLAGIYRRTWINQVEIITVVGSFGKTTTSRAVKTALGLDASSHSGRNSRKAQAVAILHTSPRAQHAVIEVAIVDKGQMEGHAELLKPNIAVVTSIGSEHMTSLGSLETTRAEKAKMVAAIPSSGLVVLNGDDAHVLWMRDLSHARVITCGLGEANEVRATDVVDSELSGIRFKLHIDGDVHDIRTRLIGRHMVYPILAAATVAYEERYDLSQAIAALEHLEPTYNRLQPIRLTGGAWLLLDAFKASLETIEVALEALSNLSAKRKIVILGDVEEPPGSQGPIYKELGRRLTEIAARVFFAGGKKAFNSLRAGAISAGFPRESLMYAQTNLHRIAQAVESDLAPGDIVLIKGRSTQHLERVALLLRGEAVVCSRSFCSRRHDCISCPLRFRGS